MKYRLIDSIAFPFRAFFEICLCIPCVIAHLLLGRFPGSLVAGIRSKANIHDGS